MEEKIFIEVKDDKNVLLFIFVDENEVAMKFVATVSDALEFVAKYKELFNHCGYVTYSIFEKVCNGEQL